MALPQTSTRPPNPGVNNRFAQTTFGRRLELTRLPDFETSHWPRLPLAEKRWVMISKPILVESLVLAWECLQIILNPSGKDMRYDKQAHVTGFGALPPTYCPCKSCFAFAVETGMPSVCQQKPRAFPPSRTDRLITSHPPPACWS